MEEQKLRKNSQLIIRINDAERRQFISLCEESDTSAAQEVRRFIRSFVESHDKPEFAVQAGVENTEVSPAKTQLTEGKTMAKAKELKQEIKSRKAKIAKQEAKVKKLKKKLKAKK